LNRFNEESKRNHGQIRTGWSLAGPNAAGMD
jgi:hypothetical protein